MIANTKIYKNFQTSIPKEVREAFDINDDTIVEWGITDDGQPEVNFRNKVKLDDIIGIVKTEEVTNSVELKNMSKYFFDSSFIIALALDNDSNKSKALELTDLLSEECYIGDNVIEEVVNVVNLKGDANKAETLYNFMMDNFKIINEHEIPNYNTKTIKVFKKFNGKLSYTDSSMIVSVLEHNIDYLVTFDNEFKREERITVVGI